MDGDNRLRENQEGYCQNKTMAGQRRLEVLYSRGKNLVEALFS